MEPLLLEIVHLSEKQTPLNELIPSGKVLLHSQMKLVNRSTAT